MGELPHVACRHAAYCRRHRHAIRGEHPMDFASEFQTLRQVVSASSASADYEYARGWGVFSLPFSSGHILALRVFHDTSFGKPYVSVWHRAPAGTWSIRGVGFRHRAGYGKVLIERPRSAGTGSGRGSPRDGWSSGLSRGRLGCAAWPTCAALSAVGDGP